MPLLKHDCRWRERMKLNQIRKLKKGVWCPVHILTMETSHKKFSSFTKVFKSAPLFSKQENCKCPSSTASISRLYPCLWVFPNNLMVSKYCQLVISSSCYLCLWAMSNVVNDVNGCGAHTKPLLKLLTSQSSALGRLAFRDFYTRFAFRYFYTRLAFRYFYTIPSRFERWKPVDESEWKWMKMDENGWK